MRRRRLTRWRHSSHCNGGACLEVTELADLIAIRDSSYPDRTIITCSPPAWQSFIKRISVDTLDIPSSRRTS